MGKNAFITGGTGFIGINLVKLLIKKGWNVTALHRTSSDLTELRKLPVYLVEGSITNPKSLDRAIPHNTDVTFHLAGSTNMWSKRNDLQTEINVAGTENMIRSSADKNVHTFVHTSSVAAWGDVSGTVTEETPQRGNESWVNYEKTKWAGERKALAGIDHGMKVVILNPAMVVGPHDANNWGRLFFALRDGELPGVTRGNMSVGHVREVAKAHLLAAEKGSSGENYLLGGENIMFAEFIKMMADISGVSKIPKVIPTPILKTAAYFHQAKSFFTKKEPELTPETARMMTRDVAFSSEKAKRELNYRIPPVRESLQDCYDWLKSENLL